MASVNDTVVALLLAEANKLLAQSSVRPLIIAIDGKCGSGKTYYSGKLARVLSASVIHCDNFFLPVDMRTDARLSEVGGNIHYERLGALLSAIKDEQARDIGVNNTLYLTYEAYDCSTDSYERRILTGSQVIIVEGSYALHPTLRQLYDLKVLFTVDNQTQLARLTKRESEQSLANFINKWIPLENRYFDTLDTVDCIVINTSNLS